MQSAVRFLAAPLLATAFLALAGQVHAQGQPGGEAPPPAVTVVTLKSQDVTLTATLPGRVTAAAEAEVRPQVNGIVIERLFDEGREVKEGDPLFRIDPTTYEAAIALAEANVAQAQAQADAARREATRVAELRDRRVASEQTQETAVAARDAADAALKMAEAQLQSARIELDRTTIRAPLTGQIGLAQVSQGALVTASQATPLAVIRRLDPVQVDVTQSAAEVLQWRRNHGPGGADQGDIDRTVRLRLADGSEFSQTGTLTAAEAFVNETTGVVVLRLSFDNPDKLLLPGMYVQAVVPQETVKNVVLAPQEGVTRDRRGEPTALVVTPENVVESRTLTVLQDLGNKWVVSAGLKDGDRIIVEGVQRIAPGMKVTPEELAAAPAEGSGGAEGASPAAEGAEPAAADGAGQPPSDAAPGGQPGADAAADAKPAAAAPADTPDTPAGDAPAADAAGDAAAGNAPATETAPAGSSQPAN
ncbi:efflux RND transporter periplasmic adaptor subunit [Paracoccus pacificus]|uniref:Efflux RND transporter periplasmic adaptor subunit n=1 Tax=Paracoccus pacificus TaxID=1463598 RepID=A0ABW4R4E3_9RHOB